MENLEDEIWHNCSREKTIKSNMPCGVSINRGKICSGIKLLGNKKFFLGIYESFDSASYAYQLALAAHEKGFELEKIFKVVDDYRILLGLKAIKRKNL